MEEENKNQQMEQKKEETPQKKPRVMKKKAEKKEGEKKEIKEETKINEKREEVKGEVRTEEKKEEKVEEKTEEKKKIKEEVKKQEKIKKDYAIVNGSDLGISTKDSIHICDMIRNKNIDAAMKMLEEVIAYKRVVRMNSREFPHKHGKRVMAGSYPINACKEFIRILKQLRANANFNDLEIEKYIIFCKADRASRPYRRGGTRFKRTNVFLKLIKNIKREKIKEKK